MKSYSHLACVQKCQKCKADPRLLSLILACKKDSLHDTSIGRTLAFSQMGVQASCGWPHFKEYCFGFHMLLHKLFI